LELRVILTRSPAAQQFPGIGGSVGDGGIGDVGGIVNVVDGGIVHVVDGGIGDVGGIVNVVDGGIVHVVEGGIVVGAGVGAGVGDGVGGAGVGAGVGFPFRAAIAFFALIFPFCVTLPFLLNGVAVFFMVLINESMEDDGLWLFIKAKRPATAGQAIDVPE